MKIDLHTHTIYSKNAFYGRNGVDALNTPEEMIRAAIKKGLGGIAITDHNNIKGALVGLRTKRNDFLVIPGVEVSTKQGHLIGLGIKENVKPNLDAKETCEIINDLGGIAIVAHPFHAWWLSMGNYAKKIDPDAIEVFNSKSFGNNSAKRLGNEMKVPGVAGSDAHSTEEVGYGCINCNGNSVDSVLNLINKNKFSIYRKKIPMLLNFKLYMMKIGRGFFGYKNKK